MRGTSKLLCVVLHHMIKQIPYSMRAALQGSRLTFFGLLIKFQASHATSLASVQCEGGRQAVAFCDGGGMYLANILDEQDRSGAIVGCRRCVYGVIPQAVSQVRIRPSSAPRVERCYCVRGTFFSTSKPYLSERGTWKLRCKRRLNAVFSVKLVHCPVAAV